MDIMSKYCECGEKLTHRDGSEYADGQCIGAAGLFCPKCDAGLFCHKLLEGDSVIIKKCSWPIVGERAKIVQISPGGFVATVRLDRDSENVSYTVAMEDLEKT